MPVVSSAIHRHSNPAAQTLSLLPQIQSALISSIISEPREMYEVAHALKQVDLAACIQQVIDSQFLGSDSNFESEYSDRISILAQDYCLRLSFAQKIIFEIEKQYNENPNLILDQSSHLRISYDSALVFDFSQRLMSLLTAEDSESKVHLIPDFEYHDLALSCNQLSQSTGLLWTPRSFPEDVVYQSKPIDPDFNSKNKIRGVYCRTYTDGATRLLGDLLNLKISRDSGQDNGCQVLVYSQDSSALTSSLGLFIPENILTDSFLRSLRSSKLLNRFRESLAFQDYIFRYSSEITQKNGVEQTLVSREFTAFEAAREVLVVELRVPVQILESSYLNGFSLKVASQQQAQDIADQLNLAVRAVDSDLPRVFICRSNGNLALFLPRETFQDARLLAFIRFNQKFRTDMQELSKSPGFDNIMTMRPSVSFSQIQGCQSLSQSLYAYLSSLKDDRSGISLLPGLTPEIVDRIVRNPILLGLLSKDDSAAAFVQNILAHSSTPPELKNKATAAIFKAIDSCLRPYSKVWDKKLELSLQFEHQHKYNALRNVALLRDKVGIAFHHEKGYQNCFIRVKSGQDCACLVNLLNDSLSIFCKLITIEGSVYILIPHFEGLSQQINKIDRDRGLILSSIYSQIAMTLS